MKRTQLRKMLRAGIFLNLLLSKTRVDLIRIKYGMEYSAFSKRMAEDEDFVKNVESKTSKTWELDLADWEFCHKGTEDWTRKLQDILLK